MSRLVDAETERYQRRMPGAHRAETLDPIHNHLTRWVDRLLHLADMVMEDEGIDRHVRQRVVRGILYGSPNEADAELRMEQQERFTRAMAEAPARMVVQFPPETPLGHVARWAEDFEKRGEQR